MMIPKQHYIEYDFFFLREVYKNAANLLTAKLKYSFGTDSLELSSKENPVPSLRHCSSSQLLEQFLGE
jgi:hypothetical protein